MTPEEVKDFVKQRFEHQVKQGGLDDISLYMSRFDTLYEQGKMEKLMPTANQKHIEENVPITEWDNPYFEVKEPEQMAFSIKDKFVSIQTCTEGYDYSVFDADYRLIDGGACDTFVNITSPTQLQDGTTYDSNNIRHHICMKSNKKLFT